MAWLAAQPERRSDPTVMWHDVHSVVMLGVNYGPDSDPLAALGARDRGVISVYAQGDDYHDVIKSRLKSLARQQQLTLLADHAMPANNRTLVWQRR